MALVAALLLIALGLAAAIRLPPIEDETYYWTWSRALSLTYFDHPPGIAWVMAGSTAIFGDGWLGLRAPSILSVIGVLLFTAASAERLERRSSAPALAILMLIGAPMFTVGYWPGTHDPLLGLAAAAFAYCVCYARTSGRRRGLAWFSAGFLIIAAGILKHSAAVLALGSLLGALQARAFQRDEQAKLALLGALLGLLLLSPWILADLQAADGGSVAFQRWHVFEDRPSRGLLAVPLVLGSILGTLGPLGAVLLLFEGQDALRNGRDLAHAILAASGLSLLLACLIAAWAGSGEANWPMPALVVAAPALASGVLRRGMKRLRQAQWAALVSAGISLILLLHTAAPFLPIRVSRDPTARGAGFEAIAESASQLAKENGAAAILARRYQVASLIRYHLRDRAPVIELGTQRRKSQYDRWPRPALCPGTVVILLLPEKDEAAEVEGETLSTLRLPRARQTGDRPIDIWRARAIRLSKPLFDVEGRACKGS